MFLRYALVGLAATGVHYALLAALVEFARMEAGLSAAIGSTGGAFAAYAGNRWFTFQSRAAHGRVLPRFVVVAGLAAIVSGLVVWAGTELLKMHYLLAQMVGTALILWLGFELNRRWSFA